MSSPDAGDCVHLGFEPHELLYDRYLAVVDSWRGHSLGVCVYTVGHSSNFHAQLFPVREPELHNGYVNYIIALAGTTQTIAERQLFRAKYPYLEAPDILTLKATVLFAAETWRTLCSIPQP